MSHKSPPPSNKPSRRWQERVQDIIAAGEEIQRWTADLTLNSFTSDEKTVKAVLADFAIIGEAASHIPEHIRKRAEQVPWRVVKDMRNVIVHAYFGVDLSHVWTTITDDIPLLLTQMRALLQSAAD